PDAVGRILDPEPQQHLHPIIAEFGDMTDRRRRSDDAAGLRRRLDRQPPHLAQIAAVADPEGDIEPQQWRRVGPVGGRVGAHRAVGVADLDHVARLYRLFQQQNDAADEIRDDLLQAEAEPDPDGAAEYGERGQVDADGIQADQQRERYQHDLQQVAGERLDRG